MGSVYTKAKEKIWPPDPNDKTIISAAVYEQLARKTSFSTTELKHWFGLFIKNHPDGYMSEESFAAEFAEFFPHGNADQISRYLFSLFDAADDLERHETNQDDEKNSKNGSESYNVSLEERVDSKKQVDFIEYMEALAWANNGCTEKTLLKRVDDWKIKLFDGFGLEEYRPYIKNGVVDDSKMYDDASDDIRHFHQMYSEKLQLYVNTIRLTEKLKFAFNLYDHEDEKTGRRDGKIVYNELFKVVDGTYSLFGTNLEELYKKESNEILPRKADLVKQRVDEIFELLFGENWSKDDGITLVDFIKLCISCAACREKIKANQTEVYKRVSFDNDDKKQMQLENEKRDDNLIKQIIELSLDCCRCHSGIDNNDPSLINQDTHLKWCVSLTNEGEKACPFGLSPYVEPEDVEVRNCCDSRQKDENDDIYTIRDALMMYQELDLSVQTKA